ncbi:MAG TPA: 2'-5' RNA ligase family protein [Gaiellaceae bacterium]
MTRPLETALVLVLDDPEPFDAVRRDFAAATVSRGIPFHLTLLYPFAPRDELTDAVLADTRSFFAGRPRLEFALTRIAAWPRVVYAVPEPDAELRDCMQALSGRFPAWPPYGGLHADVVPHVTLGEDVDAAQVKAEIERRLAAHLPRRYKPDAATLLEEFASDEWRPRERFPFAGQ